MFFNPPTNLEGFNTQPPEGGWPRTRHNASMDRVSTHSRPKAAGRRYSRLTIPQSSFNTQPPEGGWAVLKNQRFHGFSFNTQPPEGGWINSDFCRKKQPAVSTHSRPKAAGPDGKIERRNRQRFNTQPPEGGWASKPPRIRLIGEFQHTAARRRLEAARRWRFCGRWFQHTAARRRLEARFNLLFLRKEFQHTAARRRLVFSLLDIGHHFGFNTQPPEGGWMSKRMFMTSPLMFQHTAARRRLDGSSLYFYKFKKFQHTAARRRLGRQPSDTKDLCEFQHTAARRRLVVSAAL